uniref:Uncharacterized protein n=1 Tax=Lepeophtheirus salmonis TaxID=72036 RepID=A0A0K2UQF7_LEPSM
MNSTQVKTLQIPTNSCRIHCLFFGLVPFTRLNRLNSS